MGAATTTYSYFCGDAVQRSKKLRVSMTFSPIFIIYPKQMFKPRFNGYFMQIMIFQARIDPNQYYGQTLGVQI